VIQKEIKEKEQRADEIRRMSSHLPI